MADIQNKYDLYTVIPDTSYTLTGADRNATFAPSGALGEFDTRCINFPNAINGKIAIPVENELRIEKIKLWPRGAYGLQKSPLRMAGVFYLVLGRGEAGDFVEYDKVAVSVPNWGEWFEIDAVMRGYKRIGGDSSRDFLQFSIEYDSALFSCDDFNLQEDFVGQGVAPALEMVVRTAGLVDASNGQIF